MLYPSVHRYINLWIDTLIYGLILIKLHTVAVYALRICIKGDYSGPNYFKGDNYVCEMDAVTFHDLTHCSNFNCLSADFQVKLSDFRDLLGSFPDRLLFSLKRLGGCNIICNMKICFVDILILHLTHKVTSINALLIPTCSQDFVVCCFRPVRSSASEQFFLMATKCSSSHKPVVFFIQLLFTVLGVSERLLFHN